jgi:hypothetical protein
VQHMRFYITHNPPREKIETNNIVLNWNFDSRLSEGRNEEMGKTRSTILESRAEVLRRVLQLLHVLLTPGQGSGQGSGQEAGQGSGQEAGQGSGQGSRGSDADTQRIAALLRAEGVLCADFYNLVSLTTTLLLSSPFFSTLSPPLPTQSFRFFLIMSHHNTTQHNTTQHITFYFTLSHNYT